MTMRRTKEALPASILKPGIFPSEQNFQKILENKKLFQILGSTGFCI